MTATKPISLTKIACGDCVRNDRRVEPGDPLEWRIEFGPVTAGEYTVRDFMPRNVEDVEWDSNQGDVAVVGAPHKTFTLTDGETLIIQIRATVAADSCEPLSFTNSVQVQSDCDEWHAFAQVLVLGSERDLLVEPNHAGYLDHDASQTLDALFGDTNPSVIAMLVDAVNRGDSIIDIIELYGQGGEAGGAVLVNEDSTSVTLQLGSGAVITLAKPGTAGTTVQYPSPYDFVNVITFPDATSVNVLRSPLSVIYDANTTAPTVGADGQGGTQIKLAPAASSLFVQTANPNTTTPVGYISGSAIVVQIDDTGIIDIWHRHPVAGDWQTYECCPCTQNIVEFTPAAPNDPPATPPFDPDQPGLAVNSTTDLLSHLWSPSAGDWVDITPPGVTLPYKANGATRLNATDLVATIGDLSARSYGMMFPFSPDPADPAGITPLPPAEPLRSIGRWTIDPAQRVWTYDGTTRTLRHTAEAGGTGGFQAGQTFDNAFWGTLWGANPSTYVLQATSAEVSWTNTSKRQARIRRHFGGYHALLGATASNSFSISLGSTNTVLSSAGPYFRSAGVTINTGPFSFATHSTLAPGATVTMKVETYARTTAYSSNANNIVQLPNIFYGIEWNLI